jgi:hypothetical protein
LEKVLHVRSQAATGLFGGGLILAQVVSTLDENIGIWLQFAFRVAIDCLHP